MDKELKEKIDEFLNGKGWVKIRLGCKDCRRLLKVGDCIRPSKQIRKWLVEVECEKCKVKRTIEVSIKLVKEG